MGDEIQSQNSALRSPSAALLIFSLFPLCKLYKKTRIPNKKFEDLWCENVIKVKG